MIKEADIEKALDYMRDHAELYATAKAARVYLEQFRKTKKALLVQEVKGTIQERDSYAYAHAEYQQLLHDLREAVEEEEKERWMIHAAATKIDVWRTQQANNRRIDGAHQ